MTPITQSEFARRHNVSRQAIHDLVKRDIIKLTPEGHVDEELALAAIAATRDPARSSKLISGPTPDMSPDDIPAPEASLAPPVPTQAEALSFHQAKTLRETVEAHLAQVKLARETRELVNFADMLRIWENLITIARTRFVAIANDPEIPDSLRPLIAAKITRALEDLAAHDPAALIALD